MNGVKKLLVSLLLCFGLGSCVGPKHYHGIEYYSYDEIVTLPLIAFEDGKSQESSGYFAICFGHYNSHEVCKYRVLVKFPDNTLKIVEFNTEDLFIKYGEKSTITTSLHGLINNWWWNEIILEIPEGSVRYNNILDGK